MILAIPRSESAGFSTSPCLHPAVTLLLSFLLTQIHTEEGNGEMLVKGNKDSVARDE